MAKKTASKTVNKANSKKSESSVSARSDSGESIDQVKADAVKTSNVKKTKGSAKADTSSKKSVKQSAASKKAATSTAKNGTTAKKTTAKKTAAKKTAARKSATKKTTARKTTAKAGTGGNGKKATIEQVEETMVIVKANVGYGNNLYIRGQGGELSWSKGLPMYCTGYDEWVWSTRDASKPIACKVLLNDHHWAEGENTVVEPGKKAIIEQPWF